MKIRAAILDGDKTYVSRFFDILNNNYSNKIEIHAFTSENSLINFLKSNKIEILLINEEIKLNIELDHKIIVLKLVEKNSIENQSNSILKYQKISLIYKEILNAYSQNYKGLMLNNKNFSTYIISFMSSGTGSGTSTLASALALNLARKGIKTLFLDLQSFATINSIFNAEGKFSMSEIIFAIKSNKIDIATRLESAIKIDKSGVFFYDPCKNPLERNEITADDLIKLLNALREFGDYEYIIIDIDFLVNETCLNLLKHSNRVFFVINTTEENQLKLSGIIKSIELISKKNNEIYTDKINFIYNKFINGKGRLYQNDDIKVSCYIPKFSEADIMSIVKEISETSMLDKLILKGDENELDI